MSNQDTQKKVLSEDETVTNKFKDIEEAIQKAIQTETSKPEDLSINRKISSAK